MKLLSSYFLNFIENCWLIQYWHLRKRLHFNPYCCFPPTQEIDAYWEVFTLKDILIIKANLRALTSVERIIKVYMPTDKNQPVPSRSRSLLNQEIRESQGWEEPDTDGWL